MRRALKHCVFAAAVAANVLLALSFFGGPERMATAAQSIIIPRRRFPVASDWKQGIGFNFRSTSGFVTDNTRQLYSLAYIDGYPTTRTPVGASTSVTFGDVSKNSNRQNIDAGVDPRFAGRCWISNGAHTGAQAKWRFDVPASGNYEIRVAFGSSGGATGYAEFEFRDSNDSTVLFSCIDADGTAQDVYLDATCTERSEANWPSQNAAQTVAVSGTSIFLYFGDPAELEVDFTAVAHVFIRQL